jgi:hypothetical protein
MVKLMSDSKFQQVVSTVVHGSLVVIASYPLLAYGVALPYIQKYKTLKK